MFPDREKDISLETERIRRQVNAERQVQAELRKEIANLKAQLEESRQGLQAAARLGDQLEQSKQHVSKLKEEGTSFVTVISCDMLCLTACCKFQSKLQIFHSFCELFKDAVKNSYIMTLFKT